ncbi:MAG: diacylglycerol kinase family protein [Pseudomonadota bacterium]
MKDGPVIGVLRNPRSTLNLRAPPPPAPPGTLVRVAERRGAAEAALAELLAARPDAIAVDGGDGTVGDVLSHLPELAGGAPPPVAILPRGNTNLIARAAGGWPGADGLWDLRAALAAGAARPVPRPVLELRRDGAPVRRGMILGWGAYAEATRIARDEIEARGGGQVALAILRTLRRALAGPEAARLRAGVAADLAVDGAPAASCPRLLGVVTAIQGRLLRGLEPFWGAGAGPLRWLDVAAPGRRLALAAPFAAIGRPRPWMQRAGYRSGRAARLDIDLATPFVLDGEQTDPPADGRLSLSATTRIRFVAPAAGAGAPSDPPVERTAP